MLDSTYYVLLTLSPLGFTRHQLPNCWLFWLIKVSVISLAKWFQGAQWSKSFVYNIWSFAWVQKNNNAKVISIYINTKVARKGWEGPKILCSPSWVSQWWQSNDCPTWPLLTPTVQFNLDWQQQKKTHMDFISCLIFTELKVAWSPPHYGADNEDDQPRMDGKLNTARKILITDALFQYACWNNALRQ